LRLLASQSEIATYGFDKFVFFRMGDRALIQFRVKRCKLGGGGGHERRIVRDRHGFARRKMRPAMSNKSEDA
jgi:hypothetical protein